MRRFSLLMTLCISLFINPAHAGLFDDSEARKAISDLNDRLNALTGKVNDQLADKASKTAVLDQLNQLDALRQEIAQLRGQLEVLSNQVNDLQRQQKDFYIDLDNRLRKLEPQKITVDGKETQIKQDELQSYEAALALFQSADYAGAAHALNAFLQAYPRSAYAPDAHYSLGTAYYAQKQYKNAISAFQTLVKNFPDHPKAPDALLNIASCYTEQKDSASAKKWLLNLRKLYPDSSAAQTAGDRLGALK
jgi:tol-pal system protein YbgF